jgi:DNA-binding beta-propeller fold protein YncE
VAPDGSIFVADTWNHRMLKFSPAGNLLETWGAFGQLAADQRNANLEQFFGPRDVAIGPDGNVYVTDTGNSRILVFDQSGNPIRAIVDAGTDLGPFFEPTSLAFDPETGELYVADLWNRRIVKFDANLLPVGAWDVEGWDSEEAAHKAYIAVGPAGVVVFSDPYGQRVWIYSRDGKPLGTLDLPMDPNGLDQPIGVAVDGEGRILVAASNSGTVTRYQAPELVRGLMSGAAPAGAEGAEAEASPSPTASEALEPVEPLDGSPQPSATGQGPAPNVPPGQP